MFTVWCRDLPVCYTEDQRNDLVMTEKEKRQMRQGEEDAVFNRLLLWLGGVVVAEAIVLFFKRFYIDVRATDFGISMLVFLDKFFGIFMYAGLVLTILGAICCLYCAKKQKHVRPAAVVTSLLAFVWIISVVARVLGDTGMKILMLLPIVAAVLILIYFLYQRAFFVNTIVSGIGMLLLWLFRQYSDSHSAIVTAMLIVFWVVLAAFVILTLAIRKNGGLLGKRMLVEDAKSYVACWLTCAVVLIASVLALILGASVAFYLIYVVIGWLFCLAVYYTVKLI